jgi:hypothetical protein
MSWREVANPQSHGKQKREGKLIRGDLGKVLHIRTLLKELPII